MTRAAVYLAVLIWVATRPALAAQISQESFGCKSLVTAAQLMALQQADDRSSYQDRLSKSVSIGACRVWSTGEQVVARDKEESFICLAPINASGNCYWSARTLIE